MWDCSVCQNFDTLNALIHASVHKHNSRCCWCRQEHFPFYLIDYININKSISIINLLARDLRKFLFRPAEVQLKQGFLFPCLKLVIRAISGKLEHLNPIDHVKHLHFLDLVRVQPGGGSSNVGVQGKTTGLLWSIEETVHRILRRVIFKSWFCRLKGFRERVPQWRFRIDFFNKGGIQDFGATS